MVPLSGGLASDIDERIQSKRHQLCVFVCVCYVHENS